MAERRNGRAFIWVTWLSTLLGGDACAFQRWFKARHRYEKFEPSGAGDLLRWQVQHDALMRDRRAAAERDGFSVLAEAQAAFRLEGQVAILAGRPDLIAVSPTQVRIEDGKTGSPRQSDLWQVRAYLFALPRCRPELVAGRELVGVLRYAKGDDVVVPASELSPECVGQIVGAIRRIAAVDPPQPTPSAHECHFCNIGPTDCAARIDAPPASAATTEF